MNIHLEQIGRYFIMLVRSKNLKSLKWAFSALVFAIAFTTTIGARDSLADVSLVMQFPDAPAQTAVNIPYSSKITALDALTYVQKKQKLQPSGVSFSPLYQFFSLKGVPKPFLYSINGVSGTKLGKKGTYWKFEVNGTLATVGVADYMLKDKDKIKLTYS